VIIPTFDRPALLRRAIESVLAQTMAPSEIIVIDNGWTAIDKGILPPIARLERMSPAVGSSIARNYGAELATGDILAFLDDDDTWDPVYLERMMSRRNESGAPVCIGELKLIREGHIRPFKLFPTSYEEQRRVFVRNPGIVGSNFVIDRDLFRSMGGFDTTMQATEDRELAARLLVRNISIAVCKEAIAYMHEDAGNRSEKRHAVGDLIFIRKHWRSMRASEIGYAVVRTSWRLLQRYLPVSR
jgi:glycosyltransferase involved in cell wall biosynthesis